MDSQSDADAGEQPNRLPEAPSPDNAPAPASSAESSTPAEDQGGAGETPQPSAPENSDSSAVEEGATAPVENGASGEADPLAALAEESSRRRLAQPDEERATGLLKEALLGGRTGVTRATQFLPQLSWLVGVNAVSAAWPEMKATSRNLLLAGLGRIDTEGARRVRLSLARGLFKQDVPSAVKIAVAVAKDMRDKETGVVPPKDAQAFTGVFIGRAKPWVAQLPLADLKPADADLLVHTALMVVFTLPHPPATQLGIVKWAAAAGRLAKLHPAVIEAITKALSRWSGKWRQAMYTEVKDLPEELAKLVAPPVREPRPPGAAQPERRDRDRGRGRDRETQPGEGGESESISADGAGALEAGSDDEEEAEEKRAYREPRHLDDDDEDEDDAGDEAEENGEHGTARERTEPPEGAITADLASPAPKQRPVYESKTVPNQGRREQQREAREQRDQHQQQREPRERDRGRSGGGGDFSLPDTLRQIDHYVHGLKQELQAAQNRLRQKEEELRRRGGGGGGQGQNRPAAPVIPGEPTPDELARLNVQLEARNSELQARLDELREDAEARAASAEAVTLPVPEGIPAAELAGPLRALLQLKLQEDFEDFAALEKESPDFVVQQHYRSLLKHVFEVLQKEGVPFKAPPAAMGS